MFLGPGFHRTRQTLRVCSGRAGPGMTTCSSFVCVRRPLIIVIRPMLVFPLLIILTRMLTLLDQPGAGVREVQ